MEHLLNKIHLADCMDIMAQLPDKSIDLAIVDPPYGIGVDGVNPIANKSGDQNHNYDYSKKWDESTPEKKYFNELKRISKNQIIWGGNYFFDYLGYCKAPIIWDKLNGGSMFADGELAWTSRGLPKNLKIWRHQWCGAFKASERKTIKIHPTQKPVALYRWLLQNYAKENDIILDTHCGSGSSIIACIEEKFNYIACEIDADYHKASLERLQPYKDQGKLF